MTAGADWPPRPFLNLAPFAREDTGESGANEPMPWRKDTGIGLLGKLARRGSGVDGGRWLHKFTRSCCSKPTGEKRSGEGQAALVLRLPVFGRAPPR